MMILSVFISEGSRHSREKLVHGHVHFCGEVSGEINCKSHEDVMGKNLKRKRKNNTKVVNEQLIHNELIIRIFISLLGCLLLIELSAQHHDLGMLDYLHTSM